MKLGKYDKHFCFKKKKKKTPYSMNTEAPSLCHEISDLIALMFLCKPSTLQVVAMMSKQDVHVFLFCCPLQSRFLTELDVHAVTGIIVGVCLGLICILLCMCFSFRNSKSR